MSMKKMLTSNEALVLSVLADKSKKYGLQIYKELEEANQKLSSVGTMYNIIERLERKGFVETTKEDTEEEVKARRGGKGRHYIEITAKGDQALEEYQDSLRWHSKAIFRFRGG